MSRRSRTSMWRSGCRALQGQLRPDDHRSTVEPLDFARSRQPQLLHRLRHKAFATCSSSTTRPPMRGPAQAAADIQRKLATDSSDAYLFQPPQFAAAKQEPEGPVEPARRSSQRPGCGVLECSRPGSCPLPEARVRRPRGRARCRRAARPYREGLRRGRGARGAARIEAWEPQLHATYASIPKARSGHADRRRRAGSTPSRPWRWTACRRLFKENIATKGVPVRGHGRDRPDACRARRAAGRGCARAGAVFLGKRRCPITACLLLGPSSFHR